MMDNYRLLLVQAARLYDKHEDGRPEPFNVFTVLRSSGDEVNLHSRFLHALLDYKKPGSETRENLKDFLRHVGVQNFEQRGVIKIERERNYIDILITNDAGQAVVVENKIWAGDQPEQLLRYHERLAKQGYEPIHLLYLTPHGDDPSEDSAGDLPYKTVSYREHLPPWLEGCQQRACDEPELRESVAQYLHLVRKLTDTDLGRAYMNELTKLCLESDNLVLVHDLSEAMIEAKIDLLQRLWNDIDAVLRAEIRDLPPKDDEISDTSYERVKKFVTARRNYKWHGLYYLFSKNARLGIEAGDELFFGARCHKKHQDERAKLEDALRNVGNNVARTVHDNRWWPWYSYSSDLNLKHPTRENLELLSNDDRRKEYAQGIAQGLKPIWEAVKKAGLAGQNP